MPRFRASLVVLFLIFLAPGNAPADGKSFYEPVTDSSEYVPIRQDEQLAFMAFEEDGTERLLIAINYTDQTNARALWIFPVPGTPETVRIDLTDALPRLHGVDLRPVAHGIIDKGTAWMRATQFYPLPVDYVFTFEGLRRGKKIDDSAQGGTEVHQVVEKYGLRAEAITTPSLDALADHLRQAKLNVARGELRDFEPYLKDDYVLIVVRIASREQVAEMLQSGERCPCVFVEFPVEEGFYPLRPTASYGNAEVPVTLYVLDHVVVDADESLLKHADIEHYRDDHPDPLLQSLFGRGEDGFVDYTVMRFDGPARNFTSDLELYQTYLWGFDFADALTALQEWSIIYPLGVLVFLVLSYLSAGLTGLVFRRRWHPAALLGFANLLTLIGVAACARYFLEGRAARLFWLAFTVIFVPLTLIVRNILTACLWNL